MVTQDVNIRRKLGERYIGILYTMQFSILCYIYIYIYIHTHTYRYITISKVNFFFNQDLFLPLVFLK